VSTLLFGPFRLRPEQRTLFADGEPVRLGSRALDILITLCERAGEVVTREELLARVWPETIVEEANLRIHIAALRKTLGCSRDGVRYISNVMGRGYCFVAAVARVADTPMCKEGLASVNSAIKPRRALGRVAESRSAVLRVPSIVVDGEFNYVLNPRHPDFARLEIGESLEFSFDPRSRGAPPSSEPSSHGK
jgi:DNA-binding winged helix-turn-helix (wHTH) protein